MIYLDANATTPIAPEVLEEMLPFLRDCFGNPSSLHPLGRLAARAICLARERVASLVRAHPEEVLFTSGGTESNHLALLSALATTAKQEIVTTQVEHSSVYRLCRFLEKKGVRLRYVDVDPQGRIQWDQLERWIGPQTAVVSVAWANSETGVLAPVEAIGELCRRRGVLFHCDAVQVAGKLPIDWQRIPVDFLSLSAHKFHGPKGCGVLVVRRGVPLEPLFWGGGQEGGKRSGTENVPGIVGTGKAAELASQFLDGKGQEELAKLRGFLEGSLLEAIPKSQVNGSLSPRLPNTTNLLVFGTDAQAIVEELGQEGICISTGSACSSRSAEPSRVLRAMGLSSEEARASIRISISRYTRIQDVHRLLEVLPPTVRKIRHFLWS